MGLDVGEALTVEKYARGACLLVSLLSGVMAGITDFCVCLSVRGDIHLSKQSFSQSVSQSCTQPVISAQAWKLYLDPK